MPPYMPQMVLVPLPKGRSDDTHGVVSMLCDIQQMAQRARFDKAVVIQYHDPIAVKLSGFRHPALKSTRRTEVLRGLDHGNTRIGGSNHLGSIIGAGIIDDKHMGWDGRGVQQPVEALQHDVATVEGNYNSRNDRPG